MPLHSKNQRFPLLGAVKAHIFWGYRSFIDWSLEAFADMEMPPDLRVVIADKGFIDRSKTVFSINRSWGRLGRFIGNPNAAPIEIPDLEVEPLEAVLELGQDRRDFSYRADARDEAEYKLWLAQWPERRFRPHPTVERVSRSLSDDLAEVGHVVGLNTSALVAASLAGKRVRAFGPHSMANGINAVRADRLRWLRSIEWDRRDPTAAAAIADALARPELASECPEAECQTREEPPKSRKRAGKSRKVPRAPGKPGDQCAVDSAESGEI